MKQNPIARKYAKIELEKGCDWTRNQLDEMMKPFRVNRFGEVSTQDKKEYETLTEYENTIPILLATHIPELAHHVVYPAITEYGSYKRCIVLEINE